MYYHVIPNVDSTFNSLEEVLSVYNLHTAIEAKVPETRAPDESSTIPRICVAERVEDCLTSIGLLGRLRRCLADNEDSFSYEAEGEEAYPVVIVGFSEETPVYSPSLQEVPDVHITNELWILQDTVPDLVKIVWFLPESIKYEYQLCNVTGETVVVCKSVWWEDEFSVGRSHPWINGKGHVMDSSEMWEG